MTREEALVIVKEDLRRCTDDDVRADEYVRKTVEMAHEIIQSEASRERYERARREAWENIKRSLESDDDPLCETARRTYVKPGIPLDELELVNVDRPSPDAVTFGDLLDERWKLGKPGEVVWTENPPDDA